ncbi:MAG TPA: hypothetical protein VGE21_07775 [Flavobacteriales bacterium]
MRCIRLLLLALPCNATAQFSMEGFQDFEHITPYLLDPATYAKKEVKLHLHWGSDVEDPAPPFHTEVRLTWLCDTVVTIRQDDEPADTLVHTQRRWRTPWELRFRLALLYNETDSAGWHIEREEVRYPYGVGVDIRRSRTDGSGAVQVLERSWSDGNTTVDTLYTGNDGITIRVQQTLIAHKQVRTTRSSLRMAEVMPGFHFPTKLLTDGHLGLWTYDLDRKGRLKRVDHVRYENGDPMPSSHDHLVVEYGR